MHVFLLTTCVSSWTEPTERRQPDPTGKERRPRRRTHFAQMMIDGRDTRHLSGLFNERLKT
jgi:hypothetical protein